MTTEQVVLLLLVVGVVLLIACLAAYANGVTRRFRTHQALLENVNGRVLLLERLSTKPVEAPAPAMPAPQRVAEAMVAAANAEPDAPVTDTPVVVQVPIAPVPPTESNHVHMPYAYNIDVHGVEHHACRICSTVLD